MGKISDYARVLAAKLADVFVVDQTDNGTTETKSATVEQIGTAIGTLQNFADLDTSNKTLVDSINEIASYTPVYGNTASGAIATFDTSLALPLQDCTIEINAVQEGTGVPSPQNVRNLVGFTGANIYTRGSNFWDEEWEKGSYDNTTGAPTTSNTTIRSKTTNYIAVAPNTTYFSKSGTAMVILFYDIDKNYISYYTATDETFVTPSNARFIRFRMASNYGTTYNNNISINYPATDTAYHAYNANSTTTAISWNAEAGTVYGGSLRIANGYTHLVDNNNNVDLGSLSWTKEGNHFYSNAVLELVAPPANSDVANALCSIYATISYTSLITEQTDYTVAISKNKRVYVYDSNYANSDATTFATAMNGVNLLVVLVTPVEYTLTGIPPIYSIVGTNNVFTDTNGNTSVVYACSLKDYIDSQ